MQAGARPAVSQIWQFEEEFTRILNKIENFTFPHQIRTVRIINNSEMGSVCCLPSEHSNYLSTQSAAFSGIVDTTWPRLGFWCPKISLTSSSLAKVNIWISLCLMEILMFGCLCFLKLIFVFLFFTSLCIFLSAIVA